MIREPLNHNKWLDFMTGSTSSKNSEMRETKPPEGYETWMDYVSCRLATTAVDGAFPLETCIAARAELAQLRTFKEKYLEAMGFLRLLGLSCLSEQRKHVECDLCRFFKREIAAKRFTP